MTRPLPAQIVLVVALLSTGEALASEAHDEHESWHPNHLALFLGGTTPLTSKDETVFAIGVAYERRLTELLGIEGLAEFGIGDAKRTGLFVFGPTVRPFTLLAASRARDLLAPLKFGTGPGFEIVDKKGKTTAHFLYGVGVGYDIGVRKFNEYDVLQVGK